MRVIFDGKAEVAGDHRFRGFNDVFTGAEQFDDAEGKIGKTERVGCLPARPPTLL